MASIKIIESVVNSVKRIHRELSKSPPDTVTVKLRSEDTQQTRTTPSTPKRQRRQKSTTDLYSPDYDPTFTVLEPAAQQTSYEHTQSLPDIHTYTTHHSNTDKPRRLLTALRVITPGSPITSCTDTLDTTSASTNQYHTSTVDHSIPNTAVPSKTLEQVALEDRRFQEAMQVYRQIDHTEWERYSSQTDRPTSPGIATMHFEGPAVGASSCPSAIPPPTPPGHISTHPYRHEHVATDYPHPDYISEQVQEEIDKQRSEAAKAYQRLNAIITSNADSQHIVEDENLTSWHMSHTSPAGTPPSSPTAVPPPIEQLQRELLHEIQHLKNQQHRQQQQQQQQQQQHSNSPVSDTFLLVSQQQYGYAITADERTAAAAITAEVGSGNSSGTEATTIGTSAFVASVRGSSRDPSHNYQANGFDYNAGSMFGTNDVIYNTTTSSSSTTSQKASTPPLPSTTPNTSCKLKVKDNKNEKEQQNGEFRCHECNKVFNRICYLKQHNKTFHNGEKPVSN